MLDTACQIMVAKNCLPNHVCQEMLADLCLQCQVLPVKAHVPLGLFTIVGLYESIL
jgi:hypothetical protein